MQSAYTVHFIKEKTEKRTSPSDRSSVWHINEDISNLRVWWLGWCVLQQFSGPAAGGQRDTLLPGLLSILILPVRSTLPCRAASTAASSHHFRTLFFFWSAEPPRTTDSWISSERLGLLFPRWTLSCLVPGCSLRLCPCLPSDNGSGSVTYYILWDYFGNHMCCRWDNKFIFNPV